MHHPETDTSFPGPYWNKENPTVSMHIPLMIGTTVSHNPGIPASEGNFVSCVQADGRCIMNTTWNNL